MKYLIIFFSFIALSGSSIHFEDYDKNIKTAVFGNPSGIKIPICEKNTKGMVRNYYGYLPFWIDTLSYGNFDYKLLTHIAYFSVELNTDGSLGAVPNSVRFDKIYRMCHQRGVKVHMTFTLFGSAEVSVFLNSSASRANAISSIKSFVSENNLDGINIDFEYVTSSVKDSFTDFISNLSYELWNSLAEKKEVYIAMPAVVSWYPGYDYVSLADNSDGLFIMGYDYHYSGSSNAGPVSPTINSPFWGYYAVNTTVDDYISAGVPSKKIILGIPYYGYDWPTSSDALNSTTTGSGSAVIYKNAKSNSSSYGKEFDSNSRTVFYDYFNTQWHQCFYDDSLSIYEKLVKSETSALQGAGCWALGYDDGETDLWGAIKNVYWIEAPEKHFIVKVINPALNLRDGPSTEYSILNTVNSGYEFVAFDYEGYWYKIYYPSASGPAYGYLFGGDGIAVKYMEGDNERAIVKVTASLLNVRSGPSTSYSMLTQISEGQCFAVESISGDWAKIMIPDSNATGWIMYVSYCDYLSDVTLQNNCIVLIDSTAFPDTVAVGDIFTIDFYMQNKGFISADTFLLLKSTSKSVFFDAETWQDSVSVSTKGYAGLPNQKMKRSVRFKAGDVPKDTLVTCVLFFEREENIACDTFQIDIFIKLSNSVKEEEHIKLNSIEKKYEQYTLFDILGRKVFEKSGKFKAGDLPLKTGLYFLVSSIENKLIKKKILVIN